MKKYTYILLFTCLFFNALKAQDPSLSQYYFNQTFFSPALAGIHGGTNVSLTYRRQWANLPGKFETMFFNTDMDISSTRGLGGLGFTIYKDIEGEGFMTTLGASAMINSRINVSRNSFMQVGLAASVYSKTVDWAKLVFGDQIDPVFGVQDVPSSFTHPKEQNNIFPDISIGAVYAWGRGPKKHLFTNNYNAKVGIAFHHVNEPNQSFLNQKSKLPMKMVIHGNLNIAVNNDASMIFSPCLVFEYQEPLRFSYYDLRTLYGGFNLQITNFFFGTWLRLFNNTDALIFNIGLISGANNPKLNKFKMYYSYDMTLSNLSGRTTGGSHEIAVVYFFTHKSRSRYGHHSNRPIACPDS